MRILIFEGAFIKVSKVTECGLLARVWEWRKTGTDCPDIGVLKKVF